MSYDTYVIAKYIFDKCQTKNIHDINIMKLQKLVYFAHGWYLALYDKSLINEYIQAWNFGVVVPTLYSNFKQYGNRYLTSDSFCSCEKINDKDISDFIDKILEIYGGYTAIQLANISINEYSPYAKARQTVENKYSVIIENECLKQYFKEKMEKEKMIKIFCDFCGQEISTDEFHDKIKIYTDEDVGLSEEYDVCFNCIDEVKQRLDKYKEEIEESKVNGEINGD